ncbi:nicotinate phosphoribosyltransferase [Patescibacteria group bacterium]|nr:nicotinate phosphoribosyltransferase [Patescibacteria group bacterium]MBU4511741.1 nicotinate phosphoribosyltransferase [Patescibacteria group bacterium]MCG2692820.1 nicotinate phosphoribosyltransferase [Candidatus Parcubacteria bacterium]
MPIIQSLLDLDQYKLTMGGFVRKRYPDVPVKYGFTNRTTSIFLSQHIDEGRLREEFDHARTLSFMDDELDYVGNMTVNNKSMFSSAFIEFLRNYYLPEYDIEKVDDTYRIEFTGPWKETIYWETIALSIINELFGEAWIKDQGLSLDRVVGRGCRRLREKIAILKKYPGIKFIEFGTRRRFTGWWQGYVLRVLLEEIPNQVLGTSNVLLAKKLGIPAMGTQAHELFMIMSGVMRGGDEKIRASQNRVLEEWWDEYGYDLSIALPDTFGSDFFLQTTPEQIAQEWKGFRQDSGDPKEFGEKAIKFYESYGVNPKTKLVVFSDGLDIYKIVELYNHFQGRVIPSFGWGTNLTNDLGLPTLSLVVKAIGACGCGLVKLSDNLAKAIGKPEDIELYKRIFGYTGTMYEKVSY